MVGLVKARTIGQSGAVRLRARSTARMLSWAAGTLVPKLTQIIACFITVSFRDSSLLFVYFNEEPPTWQEQIPKTEEKMGKCNFKTLFFQ
jgi:hypothetical protein